MNEKLYQELLKLPRANLIHLMWEALDEMQSYNNRTRTHCIALAIRAEVMEQPDGHHLYKLPPLSQIKETTKKMGL